MIRFYVAFSFVLISCCAAYAQTITSVSGYVSQDSTMTINGSGFGEVGPTVNIFADFEEGSNGSDLTTSSAKYGEWDVVNAMTSSTYSDSFSVSGNLAARFDELSGTNNLEKQFSPPVREFFGTWWMYIPASDNYPGESGGSINWKTVWIMGASTVDDDLVIPTRLTNSWLVNGNDRDPGYVKYTTLGFEKGRWSRVTVWMRGGTNSSSGDGSFHLWYLNSVDSMTHKESDDSANILAEDGYWERVRINAYAFADTNSHPTFDDVYLASGAGARARVEIGDASTYTSCNNMTILRPTSWSATEITAVVNQGSFAADESAYLFVVDADGNISSGYPVTIGSTPSATLNAPTNLSATRTP